MAETGLEEEKAFLIERTKCSEDEAWNFLIAEESFFEEREAAGADLTETEDGELIDSISENSGMERALVEKLFFAELEFFEKHGF